MRTSRVAVCGMLTGILAGSAIAVGAPAQAEETARVANYLTCAPNEEVEIAVGWAGRIINIQVGQNSAAPYDKTYTYDGGFAANKAVVRTQRSSVKWEAVVTGNNGYNPPSGPVILSSDQRCVAL